MKADILARATPMPIAAAAVSESRTFAQARPVRLVRRFAPSQQATTASSRNRYQSRCRPSNSTPATAR
ncbi:hypothetical protein JD78_01475 [Modestobacter roseus]|uniref:Uncharacterized protein n=1 Tax=Modestobacter roseus TaxID=1181884 RepID=A0A562IPX2_9ACTN|nr:hypothetical protein JD78_01475 [Modestobacter roseus]